MAAPWEQQYETETPVSKKPAKSVPPPAVAETPVASAPAPAASEPDISTQFSNEFEREKARMKAAQVQSAQQMQTDTPLLNSALLLSPPALVIEGALAALAASKIIPPVANAIKNRYLSSSPQNLSTTNTRVDPTLGAQSNVLNLDDIKARITGVTSDPVLSDSLLPKAAPVFDDPILRTPEIDRNIPAYLRKGQPFAGTTPAGQPALLAPTPLAPEMAAPIPETTPETTPITSSAAPNSDATKAVTGLLTEEIKAAGAPETGAPETKVAGASVPETTVAQQVPEGAAQPPKKRGPAPAVRTGNYPTQQSFKSLKDIPEGFTFRPDVGNLDRSMYNILGPEHRQLAKEFLTGGQMFGQSADVNADVSRLTNQYFQRLQSEIPETILSRDARKMQGIPSDFGTFSKGGFGKGVKVAGVAGTLFSLADIANAAQQGNYGKLTELGFDVGTSAIPYVGAALTALTGTGANAPTLRSDPYAEVLNRPGVRQTLQSMSQTMSPSQFNVARDQYLSKISQFPEINTARVTKPIIGSSRPLNPNTLLPVPPPR
jgi:hypothetical protein